MSTPLYRRIVEFDHGSAERNKRMRRFWSATPFVVKVNLGLGRAMKWLHNNFGASAHILEPTPRADAWTWACAPDADCFYLGFATREQMERFKAAWPGLFDEAAP